MEMDFVSIKYGPRRIARHFHVLWYFQFERLEEPPYWFPARPHQCPFPVRSLRLPVLCILASIVVSRLQGIIPRGEGMPPCGFDFHFLSCLVESFVVRFCVEAFSLVESCARGFTPGLSTPLHRCTCVERVLHCLGPGSSNLALVRSSAPPACCFLSLA